MTTPAMEFPRSAKRQRVSGESGYISPVTPLSSDDDSHDSGRLLDRAVDVLRVEAEALANVAHLYKTDKVAREGLDAAVNAIVGAQHDGGKIIVCGVGKSAYIGMKLVATCKSLAIRSSFMHACEAAHGDLGDLRPRDLLLFVSFSGKTPELLNLLPHIPHSVRMLAMTSHSDILACKLLADRRDGILLPTPIPEKEETSFGVSAPTTSTTVALAVADMIALTVADELHRENTKEVFQRNHPGGAIGMNHQEVQELKKDDVDVSVIELPSPGTSPSISAAESED